MLKRANRTSTASVQVRHQRHQHQQHVRRQVGEDHRPHQAEPRREAGRQQGRDPGEQVGPEEDPTQRRGPHAEPEVEPVRREALHHESAAEGVEREQRRQLHHHVPRAADAPPALRCAGGHRRIAAPRPARPARNTPPAARPAARTGRRRSGSPPRGSAWCAPGPATGSRPPATRWPSRTRRPGCTRRTRPSAGRPGRSGRVPPARSAGTAPPR